jgi:anti-anti-sigma factor
LYLVKERNKKSLLNLGHVDYSDSSGLGKLGMRSRPCAAKDDELKLLNLTKRVKALLRITKRNTIFNIATDEATSLKSCSPIISPAPLLNPIMR